MTKKNAYILFLLILLIALGLGGKHYQDQTKKQAKYKAYATLIPLIGISDEDTFQTKTDKVRSFVFEHTRLSIDSDFREIWGNHKIIAQKIREHAQGKTTKRVPLECSSRSGIFENILFSLGHSVRSVSVFRHDRTYAGHAFSDVLNPKTGKWEAHDPQYNVFWRMKKDHKRLGIEDLIKYNFSVYEPCHTNGECGWALSTREGQDIEDIKKFLGIAAIKDHVNNNRPLYVNLERFPFDSSWNINGQEMTFCERYKKYCRQDIIFYDRSIRE